MNNDQIELFKQFMEFVQNVDKYEQTIVDLQDATKEYNKAVAALEFGDNLLDAKDNLEADRVKFAKDSKDAQDSFDKKVATKTQQLADKEGQLGEREAQLTQLERDLVARAKQLQVNEAKVASQLNDLQQSQVQISAKMTDIQTREVALSNKASQIQQLLG
jgi:uncharacterized protein (DUF3084 family)